MQDLRLIGVHEDGQHLLLADSEGNRFRVPLDEPLRAAVRRDRPRLGQLQIEIDGGMRPRDVQALIRAGASAEEVADRSGWSVEKVRRYEGPILAEREHVAGLARGVRLRGRGGSQGSAPTLSARVGQRLSGRGVDPAAAEWDSGRNEEGEWTVTVTFPAGGRERQARWHFDVAARTVTAADDEARWLSEDEVATAGSAIPAPHLVSAPVRATTVYDVEAEGGVAASARRKAGTPTQPGEAPREEPVDLMTAMRERASARGRRSSRRKSAPSHTPVDESPRVDALPL
ncbi:MAG TPA: septation protein SepH, partial [Pedococcus sp.]|nr:septation protein SepH [Pedococcus sp.]